ncbi:MAG: hypothetical protein JW741_29540 [Sedimentisphaerales bacterium]|nr:hypothetical protein [Sedimentisphaerales bacterium]
MCDVEKRIEQWHARLAASETLSNDEINELESHLREETTGLGQTGLSEAEAFLVARHRLGDAAELEGEFAKVYGHRRSLQRLSWMALGVLLYLLAGYIASGLSQGGVMAATWLGLRGYGLGLFGVAVKATTLAGLLVLVWLFFRQADWMGPVRRLRTLSVGDLVLLLAALAVADCVLIGSQFLFRMATARSLGVHEVGRIAIVSAYAGLAWNILAPVGAAVVVIALRLCARRQRDLCAADPSE